MVVCPLGNTAAKKYTAPYIIHNRCLFSLQIILLSKRKRRMPSETKQKIKFINQGTFGCIFRPGISCKNHEVLTNKYISKIEKHHDNREIDIGKYISSFPSARNYFAPIINSCNASLALIDNEEIQKCNVINSETTNNDNNVQFVSNTIPYVGEETLEMFLQNQAAILKPTKFYAKLLETHLYLLHSFNLLASKGVIHYDVKENNIIYNPAKKVPIIIDFGLSFRIDNQKFTMDNLRDFFYVFATDYSPWTLEIVIISFVAKNRVVNPEQLVAVVDEYFAENNNVLTIQEIDPEAYAVAHTKWREYIAVLAQKHPSPPNLIDELLKGWATWDTVALSVIYLFILNNLKKLVPISKQPKQSFLVKYETILSTHIVSLPNERMSNEVLKGKLEKIQPTRRRIKHNHFPQ